MVVIERDRAPEQSKLSIDVFAFQVTLEAKQRTNIENIVCFSLHFYVLLLQLFHANSHFSFLVVAVRVDTFSTALCHSLIGHDIFIWVY